MRIICQLSDQIADMFGRCFVTSRFVTFTSVLINEHPARTSPDSTFITDKIIPDFDIFADTNRQLRKLSIYKPMQFRVTQINIDFEDDNFELSPTEQQDVIDDVMSTTWEASDGDDLVEEITSATGFCVNSINYCYVLK